MFVESLDRCFETYELDLIFNLDEVHAILNEVIQGGLVVETNINEIVAAAQATAKQGRSRWLHQAVSGRSSSTGAGMAGLGSLNPSSLSITEQGAQVYRGQRERLWWMR